MLAFTKTLARHIKLDELCSQIIDFVEEIFKLKKLPSFFGMKLKNATSLNVNETSKRSSFFILQILIAGLPNMMMQFRLKTLTKMYKLKLIWMRFGSQAFFFLFPLGLKMNFWGI